MRDLDKEIPSIEKHCKSVEKELAQVTKDEQSLSVQVCFLGLSLNQGSQGNQRKSGNFTFSQGKTEIFSKIRGKSGNVSISYCFIVE